MDQRTSALRVALQPTLFRGRPGRPDWQPVIAAPGGLAVADVGDGQRAEFRYTAEQIVTVYSPEVEHVRGVMDKLAELGRQGIAFAGGEYANQPEYLFTRLNEVKPAMIEEATTKAREVAEKFAADSGSRLGKIRQASQGQFSIEARDRNNPHIKKVRVVSTVEYYLSD